MSADDSGAAYDWTGFVIRIYVRAELQGLYDAWTTEAGLTRWVLGTAKFRPSDGENRGPDEPAEEGDPFTWTWHGSDYVLDGKVLAAEAPKRFRFHFCEAGICDVTFTSEGDETAVEVRQTDIPDTPEGRSIHVECFGGWTFYLANLKSVLEGGLDLREKRPGRDHVANQ